MPGTQSQPRFLSSGDTALVVEFGTAVARPLVERVLALDAAVRRAEIAGIVETVPTLRSLMVHYDPSVTSHAALVGVLAELCRTAGAEGAALTGRRVRLPACYELDVAPDIADVAMAAGLKIDEVVRRHAEVSYLVYMIGFLPGHPYMGDVAPPLDLPRRATPRTAVPQGGVAIANGMTSIYPIESPGGWHLIARTPARLFDIARTDPVLLAPGDRVTFEPIDLATYRTLDEAAAAGAWRPFIEGVA